MALSTMRSMALLSLAAGTAGLCSTGEADAAGLCLLQRRATLMRQELDGFGQSKSFTGPNAELSEAGYQAVAAMKDDQLMRAFVNRAASQEGLPSLDEDKLNGIIPFYSGSRAVQSYSALLEDLRMVAETETVSAADDIYISEAGYQKVAACNDTVKMAAFIKQVAKAKGLPIPDDSTVGGMAPYYSGEQAVQTFETLTMELNTKLESGSATQDSMHFANSEEPLARSEAATAVNPASRDQIEPELGQTGYADVAAQKDTAQMRAFMKRVAAQKGFIVGESVLSGMAPFHSGATATQTYARLLKDFKHQQTATFGSLEAEPVAADAMNAVSGALARSAHEMASGVEDVASQAQTELTGGDTVPPESTPVEATLTGVASSTANVTGYATEAPLAAASEAAASVAAQASGDSVPAVSAESQVGVYSHAAPDATSAPTEATEQDASAQAQLLLNSTVSQAATRVLGKDTAARLAGTASATSETAASVEAGEWRRFAASEATAPADPAEPNTTDVASNSTSTDELLTEEHGPQPDSADVHEPAPGIATEAKWPSEGAESNSSTDVRSAPVDISAAEQAFAVFDESGYQQVAALKDDEKMRNYIRLIAEHEGVEFVGEGHISGMAPYYSGVRATQSYASLVRELLQKKRDAGVRINLVADVAQANVNASVAELSDTGYHAVASLHSNDQMKAYIQHVAAHQGLQIVNEGDLSGMTPYYSGVCATQSYPALVAELERGTKLQKCHTAWLQLDSPVALLQTNSLRAMSRSATNSVYAEPTMDWQWSMDLEASMKELSDAMAELQNEEEQAFEEKRSAMAKLDQARLAHETHSTQTLQPSSAAFSHPARSMASLPTASRPLHAQSQRESKREHENFGLQSSIDDLETAAAEVHAILDDVNTWESKRTTKSKAVPGSQLDSNSATATTAHKQEHVNTRELLEAKPSHASNSRAHNVDASSTTAVTGHHNLSHSTLSEQLAAPEAAIEDAHSSIEVNKTKNLTENLTALEEASSMAVRGKHLMFADRSGARKRHIGSVASLDELGYSQVALLQDSLEMAIFANRVMENEHLDLAKPQPFDFMIRYHSGECAMQNFQALLAELHRGVHRPAGCGGPWVRVA